MKKVYYVANSKLAVEVLSEINHENLVTTASRRL